MARKIYALLVGIDEYPSNVASLYGCVNDVLNVEAYLAARYAPDNVKIQRLTNGDATRDNIISGFRDHLSQARQGDVVLVHYSGHGARSESAPEFKPFFPDGMDEGLVCVDSRLPGNFDLADKELAVLLHEIDQGPQIVCLFDCCHSGSATRYAADNLLPRVRSARGNETKRSLESYIGGYYKHQLGQTGRFEIPESRHILISACRRDQKAWELTDRQGAFTRSLIDVLEKLGDDLSYADLFIRCRHSVRHRVTDQDPQLATYSHFDAGSRFLGGPLTKKPPRFSFFFKDGWKVNCGAIHGVPVDSDQAVEFAVFESNESDKVVCDVEAKSVGFQECDVLVPDENKLDKATVYQCALTSPPAMPLIVTLDGGKDEIEHWKSIIKSDSSIGVEITNDSRESKYKVIVTPATLSVVNFQTGEEVHVLETAVDHAESEFKSVLKRLASWHRTLELRNEATKLDTNLFEFEFHEDLGDGKFFSYSGNSNVLDVVEGRADSLAHKIGGELKVKNLTGKELHVALVHLSPTFGISSIYNEPIGPTDDWVKLVPGGYFLDAFEPSGTTERYKLIVSTEKIDGFLLQQDPIPPRRTRSQPGQQKGAVHFDDDKVELSRDWFTKDLSIQLIRRDDEIGVEDVSLCDGKIKISGNAQIRAKVAFVPTQPGNRSIHADEIAEIPVVNRQFSLADDGTDARFVDLDNQTGEFVHALEVNDIQNFGELANHPLKFECDFQLKEDENVLPVFFDGEHAILAGESLLDNNGITKFEIGFVPDLATPVNRRSIGKAFKLYFLKTYLGKKVNQLRRVEFKNDGSIKRREDRIAEKIAAANKILLLIHGIVGDTKGIAEGVPMVIDDANQKLVDGFDLILTYDYENLNTRLEDTAKELARDLENVGISPDKQKPITILAHSMGGLVARQFIENEWGQNVVDHLIMCGTPNDGSPLGKIDGARQILQMLLTLSLNFDPLSVPFTGTLLSLLVRSKRITPCLEQMAPNSDFLKSLQENVPANVRYTTIAGDVAGYEGLSDSRTQALIAKVGKANYWKEHLFDGQAHDIAVSTNSIGAENIKTDIQSLAVACHHLNYFSSASGLRAIANSFASEKKSV